MKRFENNSVDLIFADPPYGLAKNKGLGWAYSKHITLQESWDIFTKDELFNFNRKWVSESVRILRPGASFWVCGSFHNIYQLGFILQHLDLKINNSIVWFKPNAQPNITTRMFTESTEHLIWAVKNHSKEKWVFNYEVMKGLNEGKQMRNMWVIPLTPKAEKWAGEHPTQKPFELLKRIILASSHEGDTVFDPFLGSGTTSVVAEYYGRNSIGIEKNKDYLEIIKRRMSPAQKSIGDQSKIVDYITELQK
ncbi:MAG: site-specific DNA-methyltransferase [Candidatus Thermoplasmatota archaeon]|jgi:site-specific DNA-methyltransferase (adenine-specific)|nr:site-specific DNA-methyltransferase [Candidatus Thermoplasmatota archaeon]